MSVGRRWRALRAAGMAAVALAGLWAVANPAGAHTGGRLELLVTNVRAWSQEGGVMVSSQLVDRDSGEPASGFQIVASGTGADGQAVEPVVLEEVDQDRAVYEALLPLRTGEWSLDLIARQGDSTIPALSGKKGVDLEVDAGGDVTLAGAGGGGSGVLVGVAGVFVLLGAAGGGGFLLLRRRRPEQRHSLSEGGSAVFEG